MREQKMTVRPLTSLLSRRRFVKLGLTATVSPLLAFQAREAACAPLPPDRTLNLYNANTHESLRCRYCRDGAYVPESLDRINHILRDHRSGEMKPIATELLDYLFRVGHKVKPGIRIQVVSGYRSPKTNALLRRRSKRVAKNSFHMYGKAVDFRIPGYKLRYVRGTATRLRAGGVGYYPRSRFVHIDTGDVRYW